MNAQIRDAVFETNSSSSHSLTIAGEEMLDFGLGREEVRSGVIRIEKAGEFGWKWEEFNDTHTKIAYMLMQSDPARLNWPGDDAWTDLVPGLKEDGNENTRWLIDLIEEATGCTLEFHLGSYAAIDHQSHGEGSELFCDPAQMRRFLFSPSSSIKTGNDNECPYGSDYE